MLTDLYDSHIRHLEDADMLSQGLRHANASHLYGLSAECGLKLIIKNFYPAFWNVTKDKPADRNDGHIDQLWGRYETYRSGHIGGSKLTLPTITPFDNWHISDRYTNRTQFTQLYVDNHKAGAQLVRDLVKQAQLEGLL